MAALTMQATKNEEGSHQVVRSTDDAVGSAEAAIIYDNTGTKDEVLSALRALMRAVSRDFGGVSSPADVSTSATTVE